MTVKRRRISIRRQEGLTKQNGRNNVDYEQDCMLLTVECWDQKDIDFERSKHGTGLSTLPSSIRIILVLLATLTPIEFSIGQTLERRLHTEMMLRIEDMLLAEKYIYNRTLRDRATCRDDVTQWASYEQLQEMNGTLAFAPLTDIDCLRLENEAKLKFNDHALDRTVCLCGPGHMDISKRC